jgi:DNA-binding response OmpR family regulator
MRLLVIEDDTDIVEFISIAFDISWPAFEILSTHQGQSGLELVEAKSPDVIILDLGLPDIDGLDVLKQIRAFSSVPVIIESVRGDESTIVKGLDWGADEYIVKPFGQMELLARVKAVLRRATPADISDCINVGRLNLDPLSRQVSCRKKTARLTRTESLIVHALMSNPGRVVTYHQLAEAVWGEDYPDGLDAIRVYIKRIRSKLESVIDGTWSLDSLPGIGYALKITK